MVRMSSINRKLLREAWQLKGQLTSIALVVAVGIMSVVTMRGSYESLLASQAQYYRDTNFAQVWSALVRAPESLVSKIESLPGVNRVDTRVRLIAKLDLDDSGIPSQGLFLSLPERHRPLLNDVHLQQGRYIDLGARNEIIISQNFASARNYSPGDSFRAILNGRARDLTIVGIAITPEHAYSVPPGSLFPDDEHYGVMWMSRESLGPALDMEGAFNEVFLTLSPSADPAAVIDSLNYLLEPYGGLGSYERADQPSHQIMQGELDQNRVTGTIIPVVFLAVAVFLLHIVLSRLIITQRGEIAVLKAFGYTDFEIGLHYLMFAIVATLTGTVLGTVGGVVLGGSYMELYGQYFEFPSLDYRVSPALLIGSAAICMVGAVTGALSAVRKAINLPPAEAMRPEAPVKFRQGILERIGLGARMPATARMIVRNLERKPVTAFISSLGIAMSVAMLTTWLFIFDGISYMMDLQFRLIQREDLTLGFSEITDDRVHYDLENMQGVSRVETFRIVPVRFRYAHRKKEMAIQGIELDSELRRIVDASANEIPAPHEGVVISKVLAHQLQVETGDSLQVEMLEGRRLKTEVPVSGIVEDFLGLSAYMNRDSLERLTRDKGAVSGAYLSVEPAFSESLSYELKQAPRVASVTSPGAMLDSFEEQLEESILVAVVFLIGFAGVIAIGVVYNGARISLSERGRELTSLRVMGFHRYEVTALLLGEQALITAIAIPVGWALGYGLGVLVAVALETDLYRIPFIILPRSYMMSAVVVIVAAIVSGFLVKRRLDNMNIVDVLKTRE